MKEKGNLKPDGDADWQSQSGRVEGRLPARAVGVNGPDQKVSRIALVASDLFARRLTPALAAFGAHERAVARGGTCVSMVKEGCKRSDPW
ncbi:hypothetical protein BH09VER1_BH09VER1_32010 [soil metagenome]